MNDLKKVLFVFIIIISGTSSLNGQILSTENELYSNGVLIGTFDQDPNKFTVLLDKNLYKKEYKAQVKKHLTGLCENCVISIKVQKYLLYPSPDFKENKKIMVDGETIGYYNISSDGYIIPYVDLYLREPYVSNEYDIGGISHHLKSFLKPSFNGAFDIAVHRDKALEVAEKIAQEKEASRSQKRLRKEFYNIIYSRLNSSDLTDIEGVYQSIDQGEGVEYNVVILRSRETTEKYNAWLLNRTDQESKVGTILFSLTRSANENIFLAEYELKSGANYENKLATYSNAILKMETKSFIKMYPRQGDSRGYNEINPLVDWTSSGSGVLLNPSGIVATNDHVISGARDSIIITLNINSIIYDFPGTLIGSDAKTDVALLKIDIPNSLSKFFKPVPFSTDIQVGEKVFTMGYPVSHVIGNNMKLVDGIISSEIGREHQRNYFQTTLPVWYGNSGGPCYDSNGKLLGLVAEIAFDRDGTTKLENVSYVTSTFNIKSLLTSLEIEFNQESGVNKEQSLKDHVKNLGPNSVFIKVY